MKSFYTIACLFFLFIFSSCEDVIEMHMETGKQALVVEGWLTNKAEAQFVKLYFTGATSDQSFKMLSNATLTLSDNQGHTEILPETAPGKYQISALKSVKGRIYTLKIESTVGNYQAVAEVKRISMPLDSLTFKYQEKSAIYSESGYYPRSHGQEYGGIGDFCQIRLYKNGKYLNHTNDFNLSDDEFVDGNYIANTELSVEKPFQKNDLAKAEIWSLTKDAYLFWTDIRAQLQNGQMFGRPLSNTRTNLVKANATAMDVVGYFGASLVQHVERKVE